MLAMNFSLASLWLLSALTWASPGRNVFPFGQSKYVCPFLGGGIIDIAQEDSSAAAATPAVQTASAEFNVPWIKAPNGNLSDPHNQHSLAQWVGILGNACERQDWFPFLQAGTAVSLDENGTSTVAAWVEWFPAAAHFLASENMTVSPGDQMQVTIDVYTRITGHVNMKNLNTGQEYDADVQADSPDQPNFQICLGNGTAQFFQEWAIAGDRGDVPVFNNVTFSGVRALSRGGEYFDLGTGTQDYWNMTDSDRDVSIPEQLGKDKFVIYSPQGLTWVPPEVHDNGIPNPPIPQGRIEGA
ncbi:concanavalin A-like lectin/glucanase [Whalleya microplaca]|nr:concanavalin A-like lectin/glucanase [Whalleya microplaca]